jgi:hypothetical protein
MSLDIPGERCLLVFAALLGLLSLCCAQAPSENTPANESPTRLSGPYLGQPAPGDEPRRFAPGIVATDLYTRDIAMTPDGNEIYFGVVLGSYDYATIAVTRQVDGIWTAPEIAPFATDSRYWHIEPAISPDGRRFFFVSNRPPSGEGPPLEHQDIWAMDRVDDGWGEPYNLGPPVNSDLGEFFPSITTDGSLYFTRENRAAREDLIVRSRFVDGAFTEPEVLPSEVNSGRAQYNAFIDPDERYIIVPTLGREDSLGGTDYYISFRSPDDTWTDPVNLGPEVNSPGNLEYSPYVSRDGKFLFFMASRTPDLGAESGGRLDFHRMLDAARKPGISTPTIWWIDAGFLADLEP